MVKLVCIICALFSYLSNSPLFRRGVIIDDAPIDGKPSAVIILAVKSGRFFEGKRALWRAESTLVNLVALADHHVTHDPVR